MEVNIVKRKKIMTAVILFIVLLFCIIWGKNKLAGTRIYVNTDTAKVEEIRKYINLVGTIGSENLKRYYVINGIVNVKVGDSVEKGSVLAKSQYGNVISEIAGVVTAINSMGTNSSIEVQDISSLDVIIDINKNDFAEINLGQKAEVYDAYNNVNNGEVYKINSIAEKSNSLTDNDSYVKGYIKILGNTDKFIIGFSSEVSILVDSKENALSVPIESVVNEKGNKKYIFVFKDNVLEKREVTLGVESEDDIEVLSGISEGEEVVLNPTLELSDGTKVYRRK